MYRRRERAVDPAAVYAAVPSPTDEARRPISKPRISPAGCSTASSRCSAHGEPLGRFQVQVPGEHNVLNATAAIAVACELGVKPDVIREGLATFSGVERRFQKRGTERGVTVIDDYGHHPTEIRATLAAARFCSRPPRARALSAPPLHAHGRADGRFRARLQPSGPRILPGHLRRLRAAHRRRHRRSSGGAHAPVRPSLRGICRHAWNAVSRPFWKDSNPSDIVITLGAGSITQAGELILERLRNA